MLCIHHRGSTMRTSFQILLVVIAVATSTAEDATTRSTITMANGLKLPFVNLGGVASRPSNYTSWLSLGGRGLDTALTYGDDVQKQVAAAIKSSAVPREDIFLTTKVPCCPNKEVSHCQQSEFNRTVAETVARDVALLGKPLDMMLLHWPCDTMEETVSAYRGLEAALEQGLVRSIGVSNFGVNALQALLAKTEVKPAVNQCGYSIGAHNETHNPALGGDDATAKFCAKNGIVFQAYSPLGGLDGIDVFKNPTVTAVAHKHKKSPAQVALRWLVQQDIAFVTAAENPVYQVQDMDVFSFNLTQAEMKTLGGL